MSRPGNSAGSDRFSVRFRILFSLFANGLRVVLSFTAGLIVARALGPAQFGDLNFLLASFAAFMALMDLGTGNAFYTLMAENPADRKLVIYYGIWLFAQPVLLAAAIIGMPAVARGRIWLEHPVQQVLLALLASFASNQLWAFMAQLGESLRETRTVHLSNLAIATVYLLIAAILTATNHVTIVNLLWLTATSYLLAAALCIALFMTAILRSEAVTGPKRDPLSAVIKLGTPLLSAVHFFYCFADPWLLYRFGGATQQGYYSVALKIAAISLLAAESVSQVLWKEVGEAWGLDDKTKIRRLFNIFDNGLFLLSALSACIMAPFSKEILTATVGPAYLAGWPTFAVMMFYPVYVSLHHVYDVTLLGIKAIHVRSTIQITTMLLSIAASYLLLAPATNIIPGLGLGAFGVALKMLGCQIFIAGLSGYVSCRQIGHRFNWAHQSLVLLGLVSLGLASRFVIGRGLAAVGMSGAVWPWMIGAGLLYVACAAALVAWSPSITGLDAQDIRSWTNKISARLSDRRAAA